MSRRLPSLMAAAALLPISAALAPTASADPGPATLEAVNAVQARKVIVRYRDRAAVSCSPGGCVSGAPGVDVAPLNAALAAGADVGGCYGLARADLERLMARAAKVSGRPAPDLTQCLAVTLPASAPPDAVDKLLSTLAQTPGVDEAYRAPRLVPPPAATPDLTSGQWYLDRSSAGGVGFQAFWQAHGLLGEGVKVVDIEVNFNHQHEDLTTARDAKNWPGCGTPYLYDDQTLNDYYADHGTASLGMIVAQHNGFGIDGLAPAATPIFCSELTNEYGYNHGGTILRVVDNVDAGDVVLLEAQTDGPNFDPNQPEEQVGLVPVEYHRAEYDAILTATDAGVIIVEAGGNGTQDLDDPIYDGRFDRQVRDSGAIVVCAGNPPSGDYGPARQAMFYTNWGSRCDVQSYGAALYSTGYGDAFADGPDRNRLYTAEFGGTSGASPLVTGAAALLQSLARQRGGLLTPRAARALLVATGLPQVGSRQVGPSIDVAAAAVSIDNYLDGEIPTEPGLNQPCTDRCQAGLTCTPWDETTSFCLMLCEPFSANPGCPPSLACQLLLDGQGYCTTGGDGLIGDACSDHTDCAVNHLCGDDGACFALCSLSRDAGCDDGACLSSGEEFGDAGVCYPLTENPDGGADGSPCQADGDCRGGFCYLDWSGGYCLTLGCDTDGGCHGDATCQQDELGNGYCYAACDAHPDCRDSYLCDTGLCVPGERPPCAVDTECPDGQLCAGGACVDGSDNNGDPVTNNGPNNNGGANNGGGNNGDDDPFADEDNDRGRRVTGACSTITAPTPPAGFGPLLIGLLALTLLTRRRPRR